jgi:hypothetical protein
MAIFGGGVRPELGRTDYGAVARGSEIAAQLSAQGSQMMASGLAKALAGAGAAIQSYQEKKETKAFEEQALSNLSRTLKEMPELMDVLPVKIDPNDKKALRAAVIGGSATGSFSEGYSILNSGIQQVQQNKNIAKALSASGPSQAEQMITGGARFEDLGNASFERQPQSPRQLLASLTQAGANLGQAGNVLNAVINAQGQVAEREARKQEALDLDAISVIVSRSQNLQEAMDIAITQGVKDIRPLVSIYKDLASMKEKVGGDLPVTVRTVELPNGQTISFAAVWTGTQYQILRTQEQADDPAEVRARNDLAKRLEKAEAEYSKGNRREALRELRTAGVTMFRGEPMVDRDLDVYFAPPEGVEAQPKGPPLAPGWTIRK